MHSRHIPFKLTPQNSWGNGTAKSGGMELQKGYSLGGELQRVIVQGIIEKILIVRGVIVIFPIHE